MSVRALQLALVAIAVLSGCARGPRASTHPVSIDERPTPPQPAATSSPPTVASPEPAKVPAGDAPVAPAPVKPHFEADTLEARAAVTRCGGRRLLPEQESTLDSARQLLLDARRAALRGDQPRALSLARQARQLTRSLHCP